MPADHEQDPLDRWLKEQVRPLPPPPGTFELIARRARRRRLRKAVVSVASAAAVAAAVGVVVPLSTSLHLTTPSTNAGLAAGPGGTPDGAGTTGSQSMFGKGKPAPLKTPETRLGAPAPRSAASPAGYLPPDYVPSSVTWDSTSTGWVMGPAGTRGKCANKNPDICTSIARTSDGGQHWQGLPAPDAGGPMDATGVTGLRFLNASYGWAFGPELWATDDGARQWHEVKTGTSSVTDLETASDRGYALFGSCEPPGGSTGDKIANCTSFTLKTATSGSDQWTPVAGLPSALSSGAGRNGSAQLVLAGATGKAPATGYLAAPDGALYAGPLDGTAWHKAATLPCAPGPAANSGLPSGVMLTPNGTTATGATRLALACAQPTAAGTVIYLSMDNGVTWAKASQVGTSGTAHVGTPQSLTTLPDGTLVLATTGSASSSGGIYYLPPGATGWQAASLADPSGKAYGFTYVGMTSATQGVALGGSPGLHAIWMTTDGGRSWQVRPIQN